MHAPTGPYLLQAYLCERVLREGDGVATLVRIVDLINHREVGLGPRSSVLTDRSIESELPGHNIGRRRFAGHHEQPLRIRGERQIALCEVRGQPEEISHE